IMSGLNAKVVLVTGSSRGIGAAIARAFAKHRAKVAVQGRDADALYAVHGDIERESGIAVQVAGDITRFDEIEAMRHRIEETLGPIDILVANAGGSFTMPGPVEEISEEGWHASIDGNISYYKEFSAGHEGTKSRQCHHNFLISRAKAPSQRTHSILRSQSRNTNSYTGCRCSGRPLRGSRELHCPRDNSHRTQPAAHSGRENPVTN